jgi:tetratricopeptide (TPR) repeat protein
LAIENRPDFPQAHFNLGRLLVNRGRYKDAIDELLKTLSTQDEEAKPTYFYALGVAYARAGDKDNGIRYLLLARDHAASRHQSTLLNSIDRDLHTLEEQGRP